MTPERPSIEGSVDLSLKWGVIALCQKSVKNVRNEKLNLEGGIYTAIAPRGRYKNSFQFFQYERTLTRQNDCPRKILPKTNL